MPPPKQQQQQQSVKKAEPGKVAKVRDARFVEFITFLFVNVVIIMLADGFTQKNLRQHNGIYNLYCY